MDRTKFDKVTSEHFARLKTYLKENGCTGLNGNDGMALGQCLKLGYRFDPDAGTLDIKAESLPENLASLPEDKRVAAGHRLLANVMGMNGPSKIILATPDSYPSKPNRYGVYDYVIPYVTNESGFPFSFKSQSMEHGTLHSHVPTIGADASELEVFEADSSKLSGLGVGGTVKYIWKDNTTVMSIEFFLNTIYTHTFTVGFSTTTLTASVTGDDPELDGYTYLDPKITITKAS